VRQNHIEVSSVVVTGIPHYDHYFHPAPTPKYTFFAEMGLVLEKPLILFAPIGDRYIRDNHVDVAALTELSKLDANILVRLPPMDVVNFEGFESQGAHVVFQTTGTRSWKKEQGEGASKSNEISRKDEQTLIDALSYADVVVVGQSTIVIDAAAFDKPVVLTCFDVDKRDYFDSVRRYFDYEYYDSIHASGGARLAKTREELVPLVEAYLRDPSLDRAGRKRLIEDQAWNTDGNAVSRLVDVLISKISS
jgi:CDP-glycerol glycerophosphotransferase (TagB/SpsB family)